MPLGLTHSTTRCLVSPSQERFVSPINTVSNQLLMLHWFQPNSIYRYFSLFLYRILFL